METRVKWLPYSTQDCINVRAFSRNQMYIWSYKNHRENQRTKIAKEVKGQNIKKDIDNTKKENKNNY